MKLKILAKIGGPKDRYRLIDHEPVEPIQFCCESMKHHWDNLVDVGCFGFRQPENIAVRFVTRIYMASVDDTQTAGVAIAFCPWCGEAIDVNPEAVATTPAAPKPPSQSPAGPTAAA